MSIYEPRQAKYEVQGLIRMKQYIKPKSVKWGLKFWFRCASKTGYLYELSLYLRRKKETIFILGETITEQLSES